MREVAPRVPSAPSTILLLEDDQDLREMLADLLEECHYVVLAFGRGEEAVREAQFEQIDLLITDIRMDGMDGLEAISQMRRTHPTLETLVISGYASESETLRALQLRVGAYLKKPFSTDTLLRTVNELLVRQRDQEQSLQDRAAYQSAFHWSMGVLETFCQQLNYLEDNGLLSSLLDFMERWAYLCGLDAAQALRLRWKLLVRILANQGPHSQVFALEPQEAGPIVEYLYGSGEFDPHQNAREILEVVWDLWRQKVAESCWPDSLADLCLAAELKETFLQALKEPRRPCKGSLQRHFFQGLKQSRLVLASALEAAGQIAAAKQVFSQVATESEDVAEVAQASLGLLRVALLENDQQSILKSLANLDTELPHLAAGLAAEYCYSAAAHCVHSQVELAQQWVRRGLHYNRAARNLSLQSCLVLLDHRLSGVYSSEQLQSCSNSLLGSEGFQEIFYQSSWLLDEVLAAGPSDGRGLSALMTEFAPTLTNLTRQGRLGAAAQQKILDCARQPRSRPVSGQLLEALQAVGATQEIRDWASQSLAGRLPDRSSVSLRVLSLGLLQIWVGSRRLSNTEWRTEKVRFLVAYLAIAGAAGVSEDRLIEDFWPDMGERGKRNLYVAISEVRKSLRAGGPKSSEFVVRDRGTLRLCPELVVWHDVAELENYLALLKAANTPMEQRLSAGRTLIGLCNGSYLEDCYLLWASQRRLELNELMLLGLGQAGRLLLDHKDLHQALNCANKMVLLDPGSMEAHELKMRSFLGLGQPDEVVRHYERTEKMLKRDYDIEPSTAMIEILQRARYGL